LAALSKKIVPVKFFRFGQYSSWKWLNEKTRPTVLGIAKGDPGYLKYCMEKTDEKYMKGMLPYLTVVCRDFKIIYKRDPKFGIYTIKEGE